ncbi:MAG: cell wall-binding repeat-containing protein [Acidimicrobiales bacterium]
MSVVSTYQWGPDSAGLTDIQGEIANNGSNDAQLVSVTIALKDGGGNVLATVSAPTDLDVIAPGETSPFFAAFAPPQGYSSFAVTSVASLGTTLAPNHSFSVSVGSTTTVNGTQGITGTITNRSSFKVRDVTVVLDLRNAQGASVGDALGFLEQTTSDLGASAPANFFAPIDAKQPAWTTAVAIGQADTTPAGDGPVPLTRLWGQQAVYTVVSTALESYPLGGAKAAVIATANSFPDALTGGPLAAKVGGPLLITPGGPSVSQIDPLVALTISALVPTGDTVYILGGTQALPTAIDAQLQSMGYTTKRVAGDTEYGTAVAIANQIGTPSAIFEATGTNFPDALSAVPAAIAKSAVILLTQGNTQNSETAAYISAHASLPRYAIGGSQAAAGADPAATAVSGADLYGTSAAVASRFFPSATTVGFATGNDFPDALGGGPFMGLSGNVGPMLLVSGSAPLPTPIANYLSSTKASISQAVLFGGPVAVGDDVIQAIEAQA